VTVAGYGSLFGNANGMPLHNGAHVFKMCHLFFKCCLGKLKAVLEPLLGCSEGG